MADIFWFENMGVSKNNRTPKSSILIGFSIINNPFWRPTPIFWKHPHVHPPEPNWMEWSPLWQLRFLFFESCTSKPPRPSSLQQKKLHPEGMAWAFLPRNLFWKATFWKNLHVFGLRHSVDRLRSFRCFGSEVSRGLWGGCLGGRKWAI